VLFGSNGNSYTNAKQSDICTCSHILSQYSDAGWAKEKNGTAVNAAFQGNLSA